MGEDEFPQGESEEMRLRMLFDEMEEEFCGFSQEHFFVMQPDSQEIKDKFNMYFHFLRSQMYLAPNERSVALESKATLLRGYVYDIHTAFMEDNENEMASTLRILKIYLRQVFISYKHLFLQ